MKLFNHIKFLNALIEVPSTGTYRHKLSTSRAVKTAKQYIIIRTIKIKYTSCDPTTSNELFQK